MNQDIQYDTSLDCSISSLIDNECPPARQIEFYNSVPASLCPNDSIESLSSEPSIMPIYNVITGNRFDILASERDVSPCPPTTVADQRANPYDNVCNKLLRDLQATICGFKDIKY